MKKHNGMNTHKTASVHVLVLPNVFGQDSTRHPFWNKLKGSRSDAEERDNIFVF